jgi:twitching motility two-component system response regulator PilG
VTQLVPHIFHLIFSNLRILVNKKVFMLMPIGLSANELQVVKSLCWLSTNRPRAYAMASLGEHPDICLVDGDNPAAAEECRAINAHKPLPVIVLSSGSHVDGAHSVLHRPVTPSRLYEALDALAIRLSGQPSEPIVAERAAPPRVQMPAPVIAPAATTHPSFRAIALVVDDSPTVRKQMELALNSLGIEVEVAEDGDAALKMLALSRYNMVFLDVVLPGADGYQVCKVIKKDKVTKNTPVIMLTGKSSPFDRIKGSLAGCDTYLTKPVDNKSFKEVVEKYLGKPTPSASTYFVPAGIGPHTQS